MADKSRRHNPPDVPGEVERMEGEVERMEDEGGPGLAADPAPALADEIVELRKERDALQDRLLRQAAEFDNYRKRIDRERKESSEFAAADVLQDLLPIIDDFGR
jgi:molecular chaperone GrpE